MSAAITHEASVTATARRPLDCQIVKIRNTKLTGLASQDVVPWIDQKPPDRCNLSGSTVTTTKSQALWYANQLKRTLCSSM